MVRLFIDIGVTWLYSVDEGGELLMNNRIREVRKHNKLTQSEFANRLNVSQNYIYMIEKGDRQPSDRTISDICREFNVNEEYLQTGEGKMFKELPEEDEVADIVSGLLEDGRNNPFYEIILEIILTYRELSPKSQEVLRDTSARLLENLRKKKED